MKRLPLLLLLLVLPFRGIWGQTPVSSIEQTHFAHLRNNLIRPVGNTSVITHSISADNPSIHYFVLKDEMLSITNTIQCNLAAMFAEEGNRMVVKDMRVHNGICYCCGYRMYYTSEPLYDVEGNISYSGYEYSGFVLFFDLDQISSGNGSMYYRPINYVDSLDRMVVYDPQCYGDDILIAAIGKKDEAPHLVELHHNTNAIGGQWNAFDLIPTDFMDGDTFFNIEVSGNLQHIYLGEEPVLHNDLTLSVVDLLRNNPSINNEKTWLWAKHNDASWSNEPYFSSTEILNTTCSRNANNQ